MLGQLADIVVCTHKDGTLDSLLRIVQPMHSPNRQHFLDHLKTTYANTVGIYRHNTSADRIGVFDAELVEALPASVNWIAHNGAGYDQIDIAACRARGEIW
jgi:glyoxylate reductase